MTSRAPTATVLWSTGTSKITGRPFTPQRVTEVCEYGPPSTVHPHGTVLIVGRGDCPLWADLAQITITPPPRKDQPE